VTKYCLLPCISNLLVAYLAGLVNMHAQVNY